MCLKIALLLVGFDVAGRVLPGVVVVDHPSERLVSAVLDPVFQGGLH